MKIAIIHSANAGFFPRFYKNLKSSIESNNNECRLFVPNNGANNRCRLPNQEIFGHRLNWQIHYYLYKVCGIQDLFSLISTSSLIKKLKKFHPDILHFHIVNDKYLNIPLLVKFINKNNLPVVWTMHDCRAFTGECAYFDELGCGKWKTGCGECPLQKSIVDNTKYQWRLRQKWHNLIEDLTIVTPSMWLAAFVSESFFKDKICKVIYNGVDISCFSTTSQFNVRKKYNISEDQHIVLGCAINWEVRKGMSYFEQLALKLPKTCQIVLVGGINDRDKARLQDKGIIVTGRTKTIEEMAAWYQNASVFVNPTLADNFPTTNIEALAAGLPIVTFNTGGSPEAIDKSTGLVVEQKDIDGLATAILQIIEERNTIYTKEACMARSKNFAVSQFDLYNSLYEEILK